VESGGNLDIGCRPVWVNIYGIVWPKTHYQSVFGDTSDDGRANTEVDLCVK
jgi:hypothetical protein